MSTPPLIDLLQKDLSEVIAKYNHSGITLGEVVGALQFVQFGLMLSSFGVEPKRD